MKDGWIYKELEKMSKKWLIEHYLKVCSEYDEVATKFQRHLNNCLKNRKKNKEKRK